MIDAKTKWECPHDGWTMDGRQRCGDRGTLCDRCREARADDRNGVLCARLEALTEILMDVVSVATGKEKAWRPFAGQPQIRGDK
jgi:hypothetical protein